jgi:hypothetical protein
MNRITVVSGYTHQLCAGSKPYVLFHRPDADPTFRRYRLTQARMRRLVHILNFRGRRFLHVNGFSWRRDKEA